MKRRFEHHATATRVVQILAIVLGVGLLPTRVVAQHGTEIGFRGGVSVASASFDIDTFDKANRTGFVGGPFINFDFGSLGFQIAGLYNTEGVDTNVGSLDMAYFEIPAVLKLGIPLSVIKPSVFAGAAVAFRTSCDVDGVACADNDYETTDYSGVVGADVGLYLGPISLWADARYNVGLKDINKVSDVFGDLKNRNWNLTAGVGFKL